MTVAVTFTNRYSGKTYTRNFEQLDNEKHAHEPEYLRLRCVNTLPFPARWNFRLVGFVGPVKVKMPDETVQEGRVTGASGNRLHVVLSGPWKEPSGP